MCGWLVVSDRRVGNNQCVLTQTAVSASESRASAAHHHEHSQLWHFPRRSGTVKVREMVKQNLRATFDKHPQRLSQKNQRCLTVTFVCFPLIIIWIQSVIKGLNFVDSEAKRRGFFKQSTLIKSEISGSAEDFYLHVSNQQAERIMIENTYIYSLHTQALCRNNKYSMQTV